MMDPLFNVVVYVADGSYEYVRRNVSALEAVNIAHAYSHNPAARLGVTRRVLITDESDSINFEWRYGQGVTFPKREDLQ